MNITEEFNNYQESMEMPYLFDNFFEDSWDYVSGAIVNDDYYYKTDENGNYKNESFIRELTFDLYTMYVSANKLSTKENQFFYAKEAGKILEIFFSNLSKHNKM